MRVRRQARVVRTVGDAENGAVGLSGVVMSIIWTPSSRVGGDQGVVFGAYLGGGD